MTIDQFYNVFEHLKFNNIMKSDYLLKNQNLNKEK